MRDDAGNYKRSGQFLHPFHAVAAALGRGRGFVRRQKPNYRVTVTRAAFGSFLGGLTAQYDSIYAVALGATPVQLGGMLGVGAGMSALVSAPLGWLMDRYGVKRLYLLGISLMPVAMVFYSIAAGWHVLIPAIMLISVSMRFTGTGCNILCAEQLENRDRATGKSLCNAAASLLLMIAPVLAALLVTQFGGLNADGLRPLYYIRFGGYALILLYVAARLQEPVQQSATAGRERIGIRAGFSEVVQRAPHLKRWIAVYCLTTLPFAMTSPFTQVFAHEVKGADQYVLSIMTTATVAALVFFGIPFGRLADRWGRKRVLYLLTPFWYCSIVLLVLADGPVQLVAAGGLWGFYSIMTIVTSSVTLELVPLQHMGRWGGLLGVFAGLVTVPAPVIGGLIWRTLGPAYVFVIPLLLDLVLRLPLLATIPETLSRDARKAPQRVCWAAGDRPCEGRPTPRNHHTR